MLNPLKPIHFILDHPLLGFGLCLVISWFWYQSSLLVPEAPEMPFLSPQIAYDEGLPITQGQYLLPISSPTMKMPIYGSIISEENKAIRVLSGDEMAEIVNQKYPTAAGLLLCLIHKESGFDQIAMGDKGKAYGAFQIWKDIHGLTELQVFDFNYALDWTVERIKEGKGYLWTTFRACATENNYSF